MHATGHNLADPAGAGWRGFFLAAAVARLLFLRFSRSWRLPRADNHAAIHLQMTESLEASIEWHEGDIQSLRFADQSLAQLPASHRGAFIAEVAERLRHFESGGELALPMETRLILGWKC